MYNLLVSYRSGDMWAPQLEQVEALRQETGIFRRVRHEERRAIQQRMRRPARGQDAGSGDESLKQEGDLVYL